MSVIPITYPLVIGAAGPTLFSPSRPGVFVGAAKWRLGAARDQAKKRARKKRGTENPKRSAR